LPVDHRLQAAVSIGPLSWDQSVVERDMHKEVLDVRLAPVATTHWTVFASCAQRGEML
jgi:hypothetical protein